MTDTPHHTTPPATREHACLTPTLPLGLGGDRFESDRHASADRRSQHATALLHCTALQSAERIRQQHEQRQQYTPLKYSALHPSHARRRCRRCLSVCRPSDSLPAAAVAVAVACRRPSNRIESSTAPPRSPLSPLTGVRHEYSWRRLQFSFPSAGCEVTEWHRPAASLLPFDDAISRIDSDINRNIDTVNRIDRKRNKNNIEIIDRRELKL